MAAAHKQNGASLVALSMRLLSVVLLFALTLVLARYLGSEKYGIFAFLFALMQVSTAIGRAGLMNLLVRDIAVNQGNDDIATVRGYLWVGWVVAVPMAATMAFVFAFLLVPLLVSDTTSIVGATLGGAIYIAAMVIVGMLEATIRGSGHVLIGQTAELLLRPFAQLSFILVAIIGMAGLQLTVSYAISAAMGAALCALAFALINYFRTTAALTPVPPAPVKPGFFHSFLLLSGTTWIAAINSNLNLIILGAMGDNTGAGLYQIAAQLTTLMTLGLVAANASMAPAFSKLMASTDPADSKNLQTQASRSCELSLAFGLPLAVIYIFFGAKLIPLIFSASYIDAFTPTAILALGQLLNIGFGSVAILLYANKQENVVLAAIIIATATNLVLCLLLVPSLGAVGAAIAGAVSLALLNSICFAGLFYSRRIVSLPLVPFWCARMRA